MDLDFFGSEDDIATLRARLPPTHGIERTECLVALAWYLRQRDTRTATALADEAEAEFDAAPAQTTQTTTRSLAARLTLVRAEAARALGHNEQALGLMDAARDEFHALGDPLGEGDAHVLMLGGPGMLRPPDSTAAELYARITDVARKELARLLPAVWAPSAKLAETRLIDWRREASSHHPALEAFYLYTSGWVHHARADFLEAVEEFRQAERLFSESGLVAFALTAHTRVSSALRDLGDAESSLEAAQQGLERAREVGWPRSIGSQLIGVAQSFCAMEQPEPALELLQEALQVIPSPVVSATGRVDRRVEAVLCLCMARALHMLRREEEALRYCQQCRDHDSSDEMEAVNSCDEAIALFQLGRYEEAQQALSVAERLARELGRTGALAEVQHRRAGVARAMREAQPGASGVDSTEVLRLLKDAVSLAESIAGFTPKPQWYEDLARECEAAGDLRGALDAARRAAAAREMRQSQQARSRAATLQAKFQLERARSDALHQKDLAAAEALRANAEAKRADAEASRADAEAEASRAKSTFLANMSHELRSPLNAMLGFARILHRDADLGEHQRRDVSIILSSGEQLYALINQVLELSKVEAGHLALQPSPMDLDNLLDELHDMFALGARSKGLALSLQASPEVPRAVLADVVKLRQVLVNLLGNAVKFTPQGRVALSICRGVDDRWRFEVQDTGVGIEPEALPRLGQAFEQSRSGRNAGEGTGLGLAISRGFVRLMGGALKLESRLGEGTRAWFEISLQALPKVGLRRSRRAEQVRRIAGGVPGPRVLVVDDRADGRELLVRLLSPLGYEVQAAADGQQALEAWRRWRPRLILMDLRMPVMDGREAARRIRAEEEGCRSSEATLIVALTASSFEEQREEILTLGFDDFMRKPFREDELLRMMASHLGLRYEIEDEEAPATAIDVGRIAALPAPLRAAMRSSLDSLDVVAIEQALEAVRGHDAGLATQLQPMLLRFEYSQVSALFDAPA